jgi:hypothetical protein
MPELEGVNQMYIDRSPSFRRTFAGISWVAALSVIATSRDIGTLFDWREILLLLWIFARVAFLVATGLIRSQMSRNIHFIVFAWRRANSNFFSVSILLQYE